MENEVTIKARESGPYLVRGTFTLTDADGNAYTVARPKRRALPVRRIADQAVLRRNAQAPTVSRRPSARRSPKRCRRRSRANAVVRSRGLRSAQAAHSVPPPRRRALRRRAVLDQGLRERLLAALSPAPAHGDARRSAVGAPRGRARRQRSAAQPPSSRRASLRVADDDAIESRTPLLGNGDVADFGCAWRTGRWSTSTATPAATSCSSSITAPA